MLIRTHRRVGRLRDVLVLGGLIVLFGALFFPVMLISQRAAHYIRCENNLRTIGQALLKYQELEGSFPLATVSGTDLPADQRFSWLFSLIPMMENNQDWYRMNQQLAWNAEPNQYFTSQPFVPFRCAKRIGDGKGEQRLLTTYVGVTGLGDDAADLPLSDRRSGFFGQSRKLTSKDIKDGVSNTATIIETWRDNGPWARGGPTTARGLNRSQQPYLGIDAQLGTDHQRQPSLFRSPEQLTIAVLADGSVKVLTQKVTPTVVEALATVAGGEEISDW